MKRLIPFLVAAAALAVPTVAAAGNGVVLKVDQKSKLVAVAQPSKSVALVHTGAKVRVGQRVALTAHALANGTYAASKVRVLGRASHVKFRGFLLSRDRSHAVVSAGGAVVTVENHDSTPTTTPSGSTVTVDATVAKDGSIDAEDISPFTAANPGGRIEGHLVLPSVAGTITIVSEKMALVLKVPAGFDLSTFATGDEVFAEFTQGADGTLTLAKLSANGDEQEADDDNGDHHDGGDHQGDGGGDDGDH